MGSAGREAEVTRADFPDGFVFGVATSAHQVPEPAAPRPDRTHISPRAAAIPCPPAWRLPSLAGRGVGCAAASARGTRCPAGGWLYLVVLRFELVCGFHCLMPVLAVALGSGH